MHELYKHLKLINEITYQEIALGGYFVTRLKSESACYHMVQNLLSSSLLSKNKKLKKYGNIILSVVLWGVRLGRSL
jgi:hypothetical protein